MGGCTGFDSMSSPALASVVFYGCPTLRPRASTSTKALWRPRGSGPSAFRCGSQPAHMRLTPSASPRVLATCGHDRVSLAEAFAAAPGTPFSCHFWRESYNPLRVRPHAMTDQLPGGRLWDIMGLQSQRGPLSPGASLMQWDSPASKSDVRVN